MANEYVTPAELKATLSLTGETFADADVSLALAAASRGIEQATGRRFWQDPDANQIRYYGARSEMQVVIDDLVTLTTMKTDHDGDGTFEVTWTVNTDFVLSPLNAAADGEPAQRVIVLDSGRYRLPAWRPKGVQVTGRFGWATVPAQVKQATGIVASRLLRRAREAPFGVVGFDGLEAMRIARTDPDVLMLIGEFDRGLRG